MKVFKLSFTHFFLVLLLLPSYMQGQNQTDEDSLKNLIAQYAKARETRDTVLLKNILIEDIDQLVSTGVWRRGLETAVAGMQRSSVRNAGTRTLTVEHIRLITTESAIVDCRYEILNEDGSARKMWSTFIAKKESESWKIAAIRNMLPAVRK